MIYYTSDLHFYQDAVRRRFRRPFATAAEMDEALIANWNAAVKSDDDDIYIVGDVTGDPAAPLHEYLPRLNGRKHLILGNNEPHWLDTLPVEDYFVEVRDMAELEIGGGLRAILCHYPLLSWNGMERGNYHIHGHLHNDTAAPAQRTLRRLDRALNCGVDVNDFRPVSLEQLIENNRRFKAELNRIYGFIGEEA